MCDKCDEASCTCKTASCDESGKVGDTILRSLVVRLYI